MPHHFSAQLLRHLHSDDPDIRRSALIELDPDVDPVEAQDLLPFLHEEDPAIRRLTVRFLGEIGDVAALPALLDTLGNDEEDVAHAAREAIRFFRTRDAVEYFIAGAQHHQPRARIASVVALGELRNPRALPALRNAVEDPVPGVRSAALKSLSTFADTTPALYLGLADKDAVVRRVAVEAIGQIGGDAAVPHLLQALADGDWEVRRVAVTGLSRTPGAGIRAALTKALKDAAWQVVSEAVTALGRQRAPLAHRLGRLLGHPQAEVRLAIVTALVEIGDPRARPYLIAMLKDDDRHVSRAAWRALGRLGKDGQNQRAA